MTDPAREPAFREVEIDVSALARNITRALTALPEAAVPIIDLGANAFGCDARLVAPIAAASGCTHGLVPRTAEALELAAAGTPLTVVCADPLAAEAHDTLTTSGVVIAYRSAESVGAALGSAPAVVAVVLDAGRGLPGVRADELDGVRRAAAAAGSSILVIDPASVLGPPVYGLDAGDAPSIALEDPEPVMTLWAPVVGLKDVGDDEGVSYGYRYRTTRATTLALVSLGYADGLDRAAGNVLEAHVGGQSRTIAGRVAMDAFVLDVGADAPVAIGDRVVLWGDPDSGAPSIAEAAVRLTTYSAELATRLTARPRRRPVGGEQR